RLGIQLIARPALRPVRPRPLPAALAGGQGVLDGRPRRGARLAVPCALLVDGACRDLLRGVLRAPLLLQRVLDVLVLTGALRARLHAIRGHGSTSSRRVSERLPCTPHGRGETRGGFADAVRGEVSGPCRSCSRRRRPTRSTCGPRRAPPACATSAT